MSGPSFFGPEEYAARVGAVRQAMRLASLDVLLLTGPEDLYYLTGLNHQGYFAFTMLILPAEGQPILVARHMEATTIAAQASSCRHVAFRDHEHPADAVLSALSTLSGPIDRVGLDKAGMWLPLDIAERILTGLKPAVVDAADRLVAECREVKSVAELDCVRRAAAISSAGMQAGIDAAQVGVHVREIAAAVYATMIEHGSEPPGFTPLIRFRDELLLEHTTWGDRIVAPGDGVFLELSASVGRYHAPLTRMVYAGEPPPGTDTAAEISSAGLDAVTAALVPGARCCDVYAAWQDVVDAGLGHHRYRRHHCGYMVGIGFPPSWVGGPHVVGLRSDSVWEVHVGMTFHVLSWLLDQQPADYVLSDTVLVTPTGGELLTTTTRQPIVVAN